MGLEPMTDGLENRCSIRLSYHRLKSVGDGLTVTYSTDKGKTHAIPVRDRHLPVMLPAIPNCRPAAG